MIAFGLQRAFEGDVQSSMHKTDLIALRKGRKFNG